MEKTGILCDKRAPVNYRGYDMLMPVIMLGMKSATTTKRQEREIEVDEVRSVSLEVTRRTRSQTSTSEGH